MTTDLLKTDLGGDELQSLVDGLNFAEKVERSLALIDQAYEQFGDRLVVANSLGKDSSAVWHLAKRGKRQDQRFRGDHPLQARGDGQVYERGGGAPPRVEGFSKR